MTAAEKRAEALIAEGKRIEISSWRPEPGSYDPPKDDPAAQRAALAKYLEALRLCPKLAEAHLAIAGVKGRMGLREEAREHAKRAIALRPVDPTAYLLLAHHFNGDEARDVLRKGLRRCRPKSFERNHLQWNIANTYWYEGRFADCARAYRRHVRALARIHGKRHPALEPPYHSLSTALEAMGDYAGAEAAYRAILNLRRNHMAVWMDPREDIVFARIRSNDFEAARAAWNEFESRMKKASRVLLGAAIDVFTGKRPRCSARFVKSLERDQTPSRIAIYGAFILHALGRDEIAIPRLRYLVQRWRRNRREWGVTLRWEIARGNEILTRY